jgi:hypothetical protein
LDPDTRMLLFFAQVVPLGIGRKGHGLVALQVLVFYYVVITYKKKDKENTHQNTQYDHNVRHRPSPRFVAPPCHSLPVRNHSP